MRAQIRALFVEMRAGNALASAFVAELLEEVIFAGRNWDVADSSAKKDFRKLRTLIERIDRAESPNELSAEDIATACITIRESKQWGAEVLGLAPASTERRLVRLQTIARISTAESGRRESARSLDSSVCGGLIDALIADTTNSLLLNDLSILEGLIIENTALAKLVCSEFPRLCQAIADEMGALARESNKETTLDGGELETRIDGGASIPGRILKSRQIHDFFEWFDEKIDKVPRLELIGATQLWLARQAGKHADDSLVEKKEVAKRVQKCLNRLGQRAKCPGGPKSGKCGNPALLRYRAHWKGYSHGAFYFTHTGTKAAVHGASEAFPHVELMDAPKDSRVTNFPT
jgi:hypothetical protein